MFIYTIVIYYLFLTSSQEYRATALSVPGQVTSPKLPHGPSAPCSLSLGLVHQPTCRQSGLLTSWTYPYKCSGSHSCLLSFSVTRPATFSLVLYPVVLESLKSSRFPPDAVMKAAIRSKCRVENSLGDLLKSLKRDFWGPFFE